MLVSLIWGIAQISSGDSSDFGDFKLSFSTNAACYLRGDFNSIETRVDVDGVDEFKITPVGVFADNITLLSNAFFFENYTVPGVHSSDSGILLSTQSAGFGRETLMKLKGLRQRILPIMQQC